MTQIKSKPKPFTNEPRFIACLPCGSAAPTDDNPFGFSYGLNKPSGHLNIMQGMFYQAYQEGIRCFLRHRPFGEVHKKYHPIDASHAMNLDAAAVLHQSADHSHVIDDYLDANQWAQIHMPDAQFIDYLGSANGPLAYYTEHGKTNELLNRLSLSVSPVMDSTNCHLALDQGGYNLIYNQTFWRMWRNGLLEEKKKQSMQLILEGVGHYPWASKKDNSDDDHWRHHSVYLYRARHRQQTLLHKPPSTPEHRQIMWASGHDKQELDKPDGYETFFKRCRDYNCIPAMDLVGLNRWLETMSCPVNEFLGTLQ